MSAGAASREPARLRLAPYAAAARMALRDQTTGRAETLGRVVFLGVLLLVFSNLWKHVPIEGSGTTARSLLWYLAITEWVFLSIPAVHLTLERDVRTGDVAYLLPRPVSYLGMRVAEALGAALVRFAALGVAACVFARLLSGGFPEHANGLLLATGLGVLAVVLGVTAQVAVGTTAVWVEDVSPIYWVWQKAVFVLGGLIVPLHLYPGWLQSVARWTPFSAFLNGPARTMFSPDLAEAATTAGLLVLWTLAFALAARALHRRGLAVMGVHGG